MNQWLSDDVRMYLEKTADRRSQFRRRYRYYHDIDLRLFARSIPQESSVRVIACDADAYKPAFEDSSGVERSCLRDYVDLVKDFKPTEDAAEYIVLPYTLQFLDDIQGFLKGLRGSMPETSRLFILQYNFLWAPAVQIAQRLFLRAPLPDLNWLSIGDVKNLLELCGFETITVGYSGLIPFRFLGVGPWINRRLSGLPGFRLLAQKTWVVARPRPKPAAPASLTIIIPARNEAGNIPELLKRLPEFGAPLEVIFVEGHSSDHTWDAIQAALAPPQRPGLTLRALRQSGEGKGDAVRLGFSHAHHDILMILDADLSVAPEDLPHFYEALIQRRAEFVNGSRLVYRMEKQAMQVLNLFFNKLFGVWVSWLIGQTIKDTLCGTKALFRSDYLRMARANGDSKEDPFGDFDLLFGAAKLHLKIRDVPVRYKERRYGSTNIRRFRNGWQLFRFCLKQWTYRS